MRPSILNKQITFEKEVTTKNAVGTPTESYSFLKQSYADVRVLNGGTEYTTESSIPFTRVEFTIRWDSDINYKCRILYDNQYYEINHIETLGRNHWLKIRSVVWENDTSNGG